MRDRHTSTEQLQRLIGIRHKVDRHRLLDLPPAMRVLVESLVERLLHFHVFRCFIRVRRVDLLGFPFALVPSTKRFQPIKGVCHGHEFLQRGEEHALHDPCRLRLVAFAVDRLDDGVEEFGTHGLYRASEGGVVEVQGEDVDDSCELS